MLKKKTLSALLLACVLTAAIAFAEGPAALDGSDTVLSPLPLTGYTEHGAEPDASAFTETTYADPSIQVTMSHVWVDDACYNVAHVTIADPSQIRTALAGKLGKKTDYVWNIAAKNNAVVAIGGEDLAENTGTYTIRMGEVLRKKGYKKRDTLIIDQNGDLHILSGFSTSEKEALEAEGIQIVNLFNFGPALIVDGEVQTISGSYGVGNPGGEEPRTAIGQIGPLEYLLVVVDGRNVKAPTEDGGTRASKGAKLSEVAAFMQSQGCVQAYALDGGGSAVMSFGSSTFSTPSSKRGVSDILYFATLME